MSEVFNLTRFGLLASSLLTFIFCPSATPLIGRFCFSNLLEECSVVDRLSNTAQNELINIVSLFLNLSAGSKLSTDNFLTTQTLGILALGAVAFSIDTAAGVLMAKVMSKFSNDNINPLIGAAVVSAGAMAVRYCE